MCRGGRHQSVARNGARYSGSQRRCGRHTTVHRGLPTPGERERSRAWAWAITALVASSPPGVAQDGCATTERPGGCAPGSAWNYTAQFCEECPNGRFSVDGEDCSFCPHGLRPTQDRAGCECMSHYFVPGTFSQSGAEAAPADLRCSACADVGGDMAIQPRQVSCEPCRSAIAGDEENRDCIGLGTCECTGGPAADATICPNEGYWLLVDEPKALVAAHSAGTSRYEQNQALNAAFKLFECYEPRRSETGSRCRHWSECMDAEAGLKRCNASQPNCCAKGFQGPLCEGCADGLVRIEGGLCVECEGSDWIVLVGSLVAVFFMVCYIMNQTVKRFEEATARFTIAVFFLQTVALLLRGRFPTVAAVAEIFNFNLLKPAAKCIIKAEFYTQWLFGILATPVCMLVYYLIIILLTNLTSEVHNVFPMVSLARAKMKCSMVLYNTLSRSEFFSALSKRDRHKIASKMHHRVVPAGENIVVEGDLGHEWFVIVDGECVPKAGGRRIGLENLKAGDCFGEHGLLHSVPSITTVTALNRVLVGVLSKKRLSKLLQSMDGADEVIAKLEHLESGEVASGPRRPSDPETPPSTPDKPAGHTGKKNKTQDGKKLEIEMIDIDEAPSPESTDETAAPVVDVDKALREAQDQLENKKGEGTHDNSEDGESAEVLDSSEPVESSEAALNAWRELPLLRSGILHIRSPKGKGRFDKRYFELRGNQLVHFASESKTKHAQGSINLLNAMAVRESHNDDDQLGFDVVMNAGAGRTQKLRADSTDDRDEWVSAVSVVREEAVAAYHTRRGAAVRTRQEKLAALEGKLKAERTMMFTFARVQEINKEKADVRHEHLYECKIIGKFMPIVDALSAIGVEVKTFYEACLDPVARQCAVLEIGIVLYGPILKDALILLFCEEYSIDPRERVLAADSTIACGTADHTTYARIAMMVMVLFVLGVPALMIYASVAVNRKLETKEHVKEAKAMAKSRYVATWKLLTKEDKEAQIERCLHEILSVQMSAHCFLLSKFQMSCRRDAAWYPMWYMLRRTILTVVYMDGVGNQSQLATLTGIQQFNLDWRIVALALLAFSTVITFHVRPFRRASENRLEMWSLQLLSLVIAVDLLDQTLHGYWVAVALWFSSSILFLMELFVMRGDMKKIGASSKEWSGLRHANDQRLLKAHHPVTPQLVKAVGQIEDSPHFAKCSVVVTNVAPTITECRDEPLRAVFSKFGRVLQLHLTEGTTTVGDGDQPVTDDGWALITLSSAGAVQKALRENKSALVADGTELECSPVDHHSVEHTDWNAVWVASIKEAEAEVERLLQPYGLLTHVPEELHDILDWHSTVLAESDHSLSKLSSTSQWSLVEAAGKSAVPEQSAEDLLVRRALSSDDEDEDPVGLAEGGASQDVDVGDTVANPLGDV